MTLHVSPQGCWGRRARPGGRPGRLAIALLLGGILGACAGAPLPADRSPLAGSDFVVGRDTFAFANLVRAERPGWNDAFANYCLVMARAAAQFHRFARFTPAASPVSPEEYGRLIRTVLARPPWAPTLPPAERVVIPAYGDLHAFSRAHEDLLKDAFGSNVLSMVHPRTWRVALALSPAHQAGVARALQREVDAGRPVPLMITNFPEPDLLNHAVLVYEYRQTGGAGTVEFLAYDPNDPGTPFALYFDAAARSFWVAPLPYSPPGRIRAFRLYTSPFF